MEETYVTILVDLKEVERFNSIYGDKKWGPTPDNPVHVEAFTRFLVGPPVFGETRNLALAPDTKIKWQGVDISTCNKLFDNHEGERILMEVRDANGKAVKTSAKGWGKIFDLKKSKNVRVTKNGRLEISQAEDEDFLWVITKKKIAQCNIKYDIDFEFKYKGLTKYARIDPLACGGQRG